MATDPISSEKISRINLDELPDADVWSLFSKLRKELKTRKLIRTGNIVGERGEFLAIKAYNETKGLIGLQAAPELTKHIDAISRDGERYTIKTVSGKTVNTGKFFAMGDETGGETLKKFEYLIIVILDDDLEAKLILELTWDQFLKLRRFDTGIWSVTVNKSLLDEAKVIYKAPRLVSIYEWRRTD